MLINQHIYTEKYTKIQTRAHIINDKLERILIMTKTEEQAYRESLQALTKDQLIEITVKLKKGFDNAVTRLAKVENELAEKTDINDLLT